MYISCATSLLAFTVFAHKIDTIINMLTLYLQTVCYKCSVCIVQPSRSKSIVLPTISIKGLIMCTNYVTVAAVLRAKYYLY